MARLIASIICKEEVVEKRCCSFTNVNFKGGRKFSCNRKTLSMMKNRIFMHSKSVNTIAVQNTSIKPSTIGSSKGRVLTSNWEA